jgi:cytochrome c oxidase assembly protein subunit 15
VAHLSTISAPVKAGARAFTRYAWGVLAWNLFVILWGAYVRASASGAGCGSHWPLCNGEVVPVAPRLATIIEFTHRVTSGLALFAVAGLVIWSAVSFPRGHRVRRMAVISLLLIFTEALLGAGLVLLQLVAQDASVGRAFYLALHLVNTLFLLGALTLTAWYSRGPLETARTPPFVAATLLIAVLVSVTGAIAALGDTLFPASSLAEGMRQDASTTASFLVRLRIVHPVLAVLAAVYFAWVAISVLRSRPQGELAIIALFVLIVTLAQLGAGAINLALLAPIGMQILHLFLADLVWISLVLLVAEADAQPQTMR